MNVRNLWQAGKKASLSVKSNAGKATVTLCLDLDVPSGPGHHIHHQQPKRNGPSQQRRRERRSAARSAEEAAARNVAEKASKNETLVAEKAQLDVKETDSQSVSAEQATQQAAKVIDEFCSDKSFSENIGGGLDCELYLMKYRDSSKVNEAQDALNYIDEKLKYNFIRYKVDEADRVYKIGEIRRSGEAFEVEIKLKNNCPSRVSNSVINMATSRGNLNVEIREIHQ